MVDRAIRLGPSADRAAIGGGLPSGVESQPARGAPGAKDLLCSRCGAVVCDALRVKLFSGIVLQCVGCGHANRVPR